MTICPQEVFNYVLVCELSSIPLFATLKTIAHQASLSMGFPRQEYWNGLPFPSPGDFPDPGSELTSPALANRFFITEPPEKSIYIHIYNNITFSRKLKTKPDSWQHLTSTNIYCLAKSPFQINYKPESCVKQSPAFLCTIWSQFLGLAFNKTFKSIKKIPHSKYYWGGFFIQMYIAISLGLLYVNYVFLL